VGDGPGARIPSPMAAEAQPKDGAAVKVTLRDVELVAVPDFSLGELAARMTPENLPQLFDDLPHGAESW
jgi:antitoxin component of MazEF toxin-antitoxin module